MVEAGATEVRMVEAGATEVRMVEAMYKATLQICRWIYAAMLNVFHVLVVSGCIRN